MIFYQLNTRPPRLVWTQAEAKQTGYPFEQVDIPIDKQGLMDHLNALMAQTVPVTVEAPKPEKVDHNPDCPACFRTKRGAELMGACADITALENVILETTELFVFARVEDAIAVRRAELATEAERKATPTIRKRERKA